MFALGFKTFGATTADLVIAISFSCNCLEGKFLKLYIGTPIPDDKHALRDILDPLQSTINLIKLIFYIKALLREKQVFRSSTVNSK